MIGSIQLKRNLLTSYGAGTVATLALTVITVAGLETGLFSARATAGLRCTRHLHTPGSCRLKRWNSTTRMAQFLAVTYRIRVWPVLSFRQALLGMVADMVDVVIGK